MSPSLGEGEIFFYPQNCNGAAEHRVELQHNLHRVAVFSQICKSLKLFQFVQHKVNHRNTSARGQHVLLQFMKDFMVYVFTRMWLRKVFSVLSGLRVSESAGENF